MKYEYIDHTADIEFRAYGKTKEEAYENSAIAMFNSMCESEIKKKNIFKFEVEGKDSEALLYNFLEELLFLFDSKGFFMSSIKLRIDGNKLKAIAKGDDAKNYQITSNVKAVTYHDMFVKKEKNKWVAQVVLDI